MSGKRARMDERRVGRFRIEGEHGQGSMGVILRGRDESLGRTAAIKLLTSARLKDPEALARFRREAQAVALLKHDHIAALYEFAEDGPEPYLAMEWVEGVTLESKLSQGRLVFDQALRLLGQVLSALDYAHARGVIHRDIKPSNLMLTGNDRITLVDFGLACMLAEPNLTATGPLFGTPLYMAPEIAAGEPVDGRADLYSAALVFFEMLAGKPAFGPGTVVQIISQQINAPRPVLSEHVAGLPVALDAVLLKALDRRPENRYPHGQSLLEAIRQACETHPASRTSSPWKWLGLTLTALVGAVWLARTLSTPSGTPASTPMAVASPTTKPTPQVSPLNRLRWKREGTVIKALAHNAAGLVVEGDKDLQLLEASTGKLGWSSPRTGRPWLLEGLDAGILLVNSKGVDCLRFSNGQQAWHQPLPAPALASVLSGDEELFLLYPSHILALDPTKPRQDWRSACQPLLNVMPVADQAAVYVATRGPLIEAFDADEGRRVWQSKPPSPPTCLALMGHGLVVGCQDGQVCCYSPLDGADRWQGSYTHSDTVQALDGSEDQVIVTCRNGEVAAYDGSGTPQWQIRLGEAPAGGALTNEGQVLVATQSGKLLCFDAALGRELWTIPLGQSCRGPLWLSDKQVFVALQSGLVAFEVTP